MLKAYDMYMLHQNYTRGNPNVLIYDLSYISVRSQSAIIKEVVTEDVSTRYGVAAVLMFTHI